MSTRLPPELAGELYLKANIEPMIYSAMNPQLAIELLDRAWQMIIQNQITFSYNYIDKPKGSVVVDGRRAKTPARQYPLKPIPGTTIPPTTTQLPTYPGGFRGQPPQKMPNYAPPVGVPPSSPQQPGQFGRFNAVPGPVPGPPGQQPPQRLASVNQGAYGSQRHDKKSSHKKHHQQPQLTPQQQAQVLAQQQAQAQEDAEEPSGDELDFLTARDVAIARYRRNHDYIAEVFSPYSIEYEKSIEFLRTLNTRSEFDVDAVKLEHDEKIKRFKAEAGVFYKGLEELKQATTVKEVFAANGRVETFKGMTVQPYTVLRQVELPKDETILTPELKPSRFPKPTADPNATMAIATDGNESVSHDTTSIHIDTTANGVTADPAPPVEQAGNSDAGVSEPFSINETSGQENDMAPTTAVTATATASESMEMEVGSSNTAQLAPAPLASEDTEMMDETLSNEPQVGEQQGVIATESGYTAPLEATVAQEVQPTVTSAMDLQQQAGFADVVMTEEQQDPLNQPTDQTHLMETAPIVTSAPVTSTQVTLAEESSTVETLPESSTPEPMTSSFDEQAQVAAFTSGLQDQVGVSEVDIQESFTSSVMDGDHTTTTTTTTTTSQIVTTTMDESGTGMVVTTQSEGTVLHFADSHQEQFVQETVYQLVGNGNGPSERVESISESSGSGSTVAMTPMSELDAFVPTSVPEAGFSSSQGPMASVDSFSIAPAEAFAPDLAFEALSTPTEAPAAEVPATEAPADVSAEVLAAAHEDAPVDAPADAHPAEVPGEMPAPEGMAAEGLTGAPEPAPAPAPVSAPGLGDGFSA
ncbi:hypothetical protein BGX34_005735 [Mortierella sp. NVP85]|nr:hypothetical protein BGX34_005735 [Mortierella sp. NVP85]